MQQIEPKVLFNRFKSLLSENDVLSECIVQELEIRYPNVVGWEMELQQCTNLEIMKKDF